MSLNIFKVSLQVNSGPRLKSVDVSLHTEDVKYERNKEVWHPQFQTIVIQGTTNHVQTVRYKRIRFKWKRDFLDYRTLDFVLCYHQESKQAQRIIGEIIRMVPAGTKVTEKNLINTLQAILTNEEVTEQQVYKKWSGNILHHHYTVLAAHWFHLKWFHYLRLDVKKCMRFQGNTPQFLEHMFVYS